MNEWMVFLYRRPKRVQNSDKEHYLKGRIVYIYVSALSQRTAVSLQHGGCYPNKGPARFGFSWGDRVS